MKILSASEIRQADAYTIKHEPVSSIDLMERAAKACVSWIRENCSNTETFKIFCGPGNNGGDGLAIARLLLSSGFNADVFIIHAEKFSSDFQANEIRLKKISPEVIHYVRAENDLPELTPSDKIIDAIFGTGLSKPTGGIFASVINRINTSGSAVISIDMPSGLFADKLTGNDTVIHATDTLSFQVPKLAFMFHENEKYVGQFHLLDIGLAKDFIDSLRQGNEYLTEDFVRQILRPRNKFSHKGNYGHALVMAGSIGKMGAAVLAVKGCLRAGAGLVSAKVPEDCYDIMQISCPEAMLATDEIDLRKISAIGIGPGIGITSDMKKIIGKIFRSDKPLVIDADALNIISEYKELLNQIPANSVLTPHPKEFERLSGKARDDFERHEMQVTFSTRHKVFTILKGAHTCITTPDGTSYFNSTGNPGMAKGGSGDVLTGLLTGLLAQDYSALDASMLGVYLHGLAGDLAAEKKGMDGMIARDLVNALPHVWKKIRAT